MDCDWLDLLCVDGLGDVEDWGGGDCTHAVHSVASEQFIEKLFNAHQKNDVVKSLARLSASKDSQIDSRPCTLEELFDELGSAEDNGGVPQKNNVENFQWDVTPKKSSNWKKK